MKIVIIGATGRIGKQVSAALEIDHELVGAGSQSGEYMLDIRSVDSITDFFEKIGSFDALISTTGKGHFGSLSTLNDINFRIGIDNKLMGQINLVLIGQRYLNAGGSFTLTSGILSRIPVTQGAILSAVNGALESFTVAAAIELTDGKRINCISPGIIEGSTNLLPFFPGHEPVKMKSVVAAYLESVLGDLSGQVIDIH